MTHIHTAALVLTVRQHGENGAIVRVLTPDDGVCAGYLAGAHSRQLRPILIPGNLVVADIRSRGGDQLGALRVELLTSRAALLSEPLAAAAIEWVTLATAALLADNQRYDDVYPALSGLIAAIALAPAARGWAAALVRYELLLLSRTGFGLQLDACVVTGATSALTYVSPRSAAAVSAGAAVGHERHLIPLPAFVRAGGAASLDDALAGLALSGHFLRGQISGPRRDAIIGVRDRLLDRLQRAV